MIFLIFTLVIALIVAIFAVQNAAPVAINLLWYVAEVPLVLVILGSALAGALIVFFMAIWREFRIKGKAKTKAKADAKALTEAEAAKAKAISEAAKAEIAKAEAMAASESKPADEGV
ncbi:MAG: LapA family protein [Desulfitobacterium sp.]